MLGEEVVANVKAKQEGNTKIQTAEASFFK